MSACTVRVEGRAFLSFPFVLASIAVGVVAGCGTSRVYEGARRPPSEVAIVESQSYSSDPISWVVHDVERSFESDLLRHIDIDIRAVDGRRVQSSRVEMLPGPHQLAVQIRGHGNQVLTRGILEFTAQAGQRYAVRAVRSEHRGPCAVGVVEEPSGRLLATDERQLEDVLPIAVPGWLSSWTVTSWKEEYFPDTVTWSPGSEAGPPAQVRLEAIREEAGDEERDFTSKKWRRKFAHEYSNPTTLQATVDMFAFEASVGPLGDGGFRHVLGLLRRSGASVYTLKYSRADRPLDEPERREWLARLQAIEPRAAPVADENARSSSQASAAPASSRAGDGDD